MSFPPWLEWNEESNKLLFFGIESALFWQIPSLSTILRPLIEELGDSFAYLLIAYEASKGTHEDYHNMVTKLGSTFEEGLINWGKTVQTAGWGRLELISIDWDKGQASLALENPWELNIHRADNVEDNIPFYCGKLSGLFTQAFEQNARAKVVDIITTPKNTTARIEVRLSHSTIRSELQALYEKEGFTRYEKLQFMNKQLKQLSIELKQANYKLRQMTVTDELTGTFNRRHFMKLAEEELEEVRLHNRVSSIMLLDFDDFKKVNDQYGHRMGDLALIEFARVCKNELRSTDVLGRIGGEEFAIVLPKTSIAEAQVLAEHLCLAVSKIQISNDAKTLTFTTSVGVTEMLPEDTIDRSINRADKAMYQAKDAGKNKVVAHDVNLLSR